MYTVCLAVYLSFSSDANYLLSKMSDDVNAGNQTAKSIIASCENELRSMFLEEKSHSKYDGSIHLEYIIALVAAFNHQVSANTKRFVVSYTMILK